MTVKWILTTKANSTRILYRAWIETVQLLYCITKRSRLVRLEGDVFLVHLAHDGHLPKLGCKATRRVGSASLMGPHGWVLNIYEDPTHKWIPNGSWVPVNGVVYEAYIVARIAVILLYSYRMTSILFTVVRIRVHTHY